MLDGRQTGIVFSIKTENIQKRKQKYYLMKDIKVVESSYNDPW